MPQNYGPQINPCLKLRPNGYRAQINENRIERLHIYEVLGGFSIVATLDLFSPTTAHLGRLKAVWNITVVYKSHNLRAFPLDVSCMLFFGQTLEKCGLLSSYFLSSVCL